MKSKQKLHVALRDTPASILSKETGIAASTIISYGKREDRTYWIGTNDDGKKVIGTNRGWVYVTPQKQKPGARKRSY